MEACDGKDNDCDGMTDENIAKVTCGAGACLMTVDGCKDGMVPPCMPGQPKDETCNGVDDDCDFFIDDNLGELTCGVGGCQVTVQACSGGVPQTCVPGMAMPEVCDGVDNNCNGTTDEGNPGGGVSCNTMLPGVCAMGTLNCTTGALKCEPNTMPTAEICDAKDNDCNGMIDDGNPGGGQPCMTGLQGACALGTSGCTNGMITCKQTTMPKNETCNGVDDNCNGATDEGTAGMMCTVPGKFGVCAVSTSQCQNGTLLCPQTVNPSMEICNGLDDNCNNVVDDGDPGSGGNCTVPGQVGPCANGTFHCVNGSLQCPQSNFAVTEVCGDNIDNDCNGVVDNGCCPHSLSGRCGDAFRLWKRLCRGCLYVRRRPMVQLLFANLGQQLYAHCGRGLWRRNLLRARYLHVGSASAERMQFLHFGRLCGQTFLLHDRLERGLSGPRADVLQWYVVQRQHANLRAQRVYDGRTTQYAMQCLRRCDLRFAAFVLRQRSRFLDRRLCRRRRDQVHRGMGLPLIASLRMTIGGFGPRFSKSPQR